MLANPANCESSANIYMNIYARVRLEIKKERVEIAVQEQVMAEHAEAAKQS
jgi:hypothetical protein